MLWPGGGGGHLLSYHNLFKFSQGLFSKAILTLVFLPISNIFLAPQTKAGGAPLPALGSPTWKVGGKGRGGSFYTFFSLSFIFPPSLLHPYRPYVFPVQGGEEEVEPLLRVEEGEANKSESS